MVFHSSFIIISVFRYNFGLSEFERVQIPEIWNQESGISPTPEKTLCHAPFLAYSVLGRSPCHPDPSSEHTVPFFYPVLFIKRRQSPTLRKNALS